MKYDFCYEMEDLQGETVKVYGNDGGRAYVDFWDFDENKQTVRVFEGGEAAAYDWAYKRGYRE